MAQTIDSTLRSFGGPKPSVSDRVDVHTEASRIIHVVIQSQRMAADERPNQATLSFPTEFQLGHLRDGRLRVNQPISVTWMVEDGQVIAEAPEINEFGYGDTIADAIEDLQATIVELFFTLDEYKDRLGPDLENVYTTLIRKLHKIDANHRS